MSDVEVNIETEKKDIPSHKEDTDPKVIFQKLIDQVKSYAPNQDLSILEKAYLFAESKHGNQKRQSGEAYISHPLSVALIVAQMQIDLQSITAAILHDVVEDTAATIDEIEKDFSKPVAELVDGLTKISKIEFRSNHERLAENFRKMVMAMAKDLRVILVKLADRLHNMRTIKALPPAKRKRIAQETMDIYAPLANRLGLYSVKSELEDLCLRQLKPEVYEEIKKNIQSKKLERQKQMDLVRNELLSELSKYDFKKVEVRGRAKHFYSIYKKMLERQLSFEDIHDLFAFRIIVDSVKDCYEALGIVHALWKPMPGRFKDYVAMPKANLYQSLHTTVIRPNGEPAEIQIRTAQMHHVCEYGVAAHWNYKERGSTTAGVNTELQKLAWLKQIVEWQNELKDPNEFMEAVKVDLFEEEIFVFTPKGDVLQLPAGATALDFAFGVHTHVGSTTVGAKVNGTMVSIKKVLKSGDIIEILTSAKQRPSKDWLLFITTSKAKNRIRSFLRAEQREKSRKLGKDILQHELTQKNLDFEKLTKSNGVDEILKHSREANLEDVLCAIGYGKIDARELIEKAFPTAEKAPKKISESVIPDERTGKNISKGKGILVSGLDNILVSFARCCSPLPGEDITGFVTRGKGVTIHRRNCDRAFDMDPKRQVDVDWGNSADLTGEFLTHLSVVVYDRPGVFADVTVAISQTGANILKAQVHVGKDFKGYLDFEIIVKNHSQLQIILSKIETVESVIQVQRKVSGDFKKTKKRTKK